MRSSLIFLTILFVVLLGISAYEHIGLMKKLPFEPSTIGPAQRTRTRLRIRHRILLVSVKPR